MRNLFYAGLIHSGYLVKDPQFFSQSVFGLINTAFSVSNEVEEIVVTEEDIAAMEEAEAPAAAEEPVLDERVASEEVLDLDVDAEIEAQEVQEPENDEL